MAGADRRAAGTLNSERRKAASVVDSKRGGGTMWCLLREGV